MPRPSCTICGQRQHGRLHVSGDHEYTPPPAERKKPKRLGLSTKPKRVQRRQEVAEARSQRREAVRHCEAAEAGIETPCGSGLEAVLDASHVYGLGMGGGKEHGEIRMLCRRHHAELDRDRAAFRAAGLSLRAPVPEKVVERPQIRSRHD